MTDFYSNTGHCVVGMEVTAMSRGGGTVGQQAQIKDFHKKTCFTEKNYTSFYLRSKNAPRAKKACNFDILDHSCFKHFLWKYLRGVGSFF